MSPVEQQSEREVPRTLLPLANPPTFALAASWAVILLMSVAFVAGAISPGILYPGNDQSSRPTDLVQFVGAPLLLASVVMTRRGSLVWLLLWPGILVYLLYHDLAYLLMMRLNPMLVLHLVLAALNLFATVGLVSAINKGAVQSMLAGAVYEKLGGAVLASFGTLICISALAGILGHLFKQTAISPSELALHVTDFLMSPTWIIGGVLLWARKPLGYAVGPGLLFQASMLFVGLILLFVLQTVISGVAFRIVDTVAVCALGTICFVPCCLFVRGVLQRTGKSGGAL